MEIDDELSQKITALMPTCLDDIVRSRREILTIRLATEQEVMALHHEISPNRSPKTVLEDWHLVAFAKSIEGLHEVEISLLGDLPYGEPRITSSVQKIDLDRQLIITRSGTLYGLGKHGDGEPPFEHLAAICAAAHSWGWGRYFDIPKFFF